MTREGFFRLVRNARTRSGVSDEDIMRKTGMSQERLQAFESGSTNYLVNRVLEYLVAVKAELCLYDTVNTYVITDADQMQWVFQTIRKTYKLKPSQMADMMGLTPANIYNLERNINGLSIDLLLLLCTNLRITVTITGYARVQATKTQRGIMQVAAIMSVWFLLSTSGYICASKAQAADSDILMTVAKVLIAASLITFFCIGCVDGEPNLFKRKLHALLHPRDFERQFINWMKAIGVLVGGLGTPFIAIVIICNGNEGLGGALFLIWFFIVGSLFIDPYNNNRRHR